MKSDESTKEMRLWIRIRVERDFFNRIVTGGMEVEFSRENERIF